MPQRRSPGEGSIHEWQGQFRGYLTLPSEIVDGKVRRRRRYAYGQTRADVRVALDKLKDEQAAKNGNLASAADRTTVAGYLTAWADALEVRPETKRQYRWIARGYLVKRLGMIRLDRLSYHDLEQFRAKLLAEGIGDRTRQLCHDVLRIALHQAIRAKILASNPMEGLVRPKVERRDVDPWTAAEAKLVLAAAREDRFHALYEIMLRLGPQIPGEVFGLRRRDVDLEKRTMRIGAQLATKTRERAPTKRDARRRELDLPAAVVEALRAHYARLTEEKLSSSEWVFPNRRGGPMHYGTFMRDSFSVVVARAGRLCKSCGRESSDHSPGDACKTWVASVRRIRPYDMRHTFATLALIAGVHIKTVSRILGHADVTETLRTYSHFVPSQVEDANVRIGALLGDAEGV